MRDGRRWWSGSSTASGAPCGTDRHGRGVRQAGIGLRSLTEAIDTSTAAASWSSISSPPWPSSSGTSSASAPGPACRRPGRGAAPAAGPSCPQGRGPGCRQGPAQGSRDHRARGRPTPRRRPPHPLPAATRRGQHTPRVATVSISYNIENQQLADYSGWRSAYFAKKARKAASDCAALLAGRPVAPLPLDVVDVVARERRRASSNVSPLRCKARRSAVPGVRSRSSRPCPPCGPFGLPSAAAARSRRDAPLRVLAAPGEPHAGHLAARFHGLDGDIEVRQGRHLLHGRRDRLADSGCPRAAACRGMPSSSRNSRSANSSWFTAVSCRASAPSHRGQARTCWRARTSPRCAAAQRWCSRRMIRRSLAGNS